MPMSSGNRSFRNVKTFVCEEVKSKRDDWRNFYFSVNFSMTKGQVIRSVSPFSKAEGCHFFRSIAKRDSKNLRYHHGLRSLF